ncbi:MAG: hypothetical protein KF809_14060 [Chloroflexi bacterium]|nr:hypothetical protein [Chloroflexota bacterium]
MTALHRGRSALTLILAMLLSLVCVTSALASDPVPSPTPGTPTGTTSPDASASPGGDPGTSPLPTATPRLQPLPSLDPVPPLATPGPRLAKEVVAYLPYWVVAAANVPWDPATEPWIRDGRLTDVVLFSIGMRRNGSLRLDEPGARMILGPGGTAVIREAHARGIRVLVSFTSFGRERNAAFFANQAAMDRFVAEAAQLVRARGLDGADLDVEQLDGEWFRSYGALVRALGRALRAQDPDARVTVATNGASSGARMALRAFRGGADRAFLMGYAYRGPTSPTTGTIAPLDRRGAGLDLRDSLELYRGRGVPLDQVLVGLPLYGMTWATTGPERNARRAPTSVSARGAVSLFRNVGVGLPPGPVIADTDPVESSARLAWFDPARGSWFQTYYDTPVTIRAKYLLAHELGLAGIGLWTLGYDAGLEGYAALADEAFGRPVIDAVHLAAAVTDQPVVRIGATVYPAHAPVIGMRIAPDGRTWGEWLDPASFDPRQGGPLAWELGDGPDGRYEVWLEAMDEAGARSMPVMASVLLDRAPPTLEGPSLRPGPVPGSWIVLFAARDAGGVASVEVRWQADGAGWSAWRVLDSLAAGSVVAPVGSLVEVEVRVTDHAGRTTVGGARVR